MHTTAEKRIIVLCVAVGFAVALALAPKDSSFIPNFLFFWVPHLAILALLFPFKPHMGIYAGVSLALASYLAAFGAWLFAHRQPESMARLGYLFSPPGGVLGAFAAIYWQRRGAAAPYLLIGAAAFAFVLGGIAANQALVCSTLMHCGLPGDA